MGSWSPRGPLVPFFPLPFSANMWLYKKLSADISGSPTEDKMELKGLITPCFLAGRSGTCCWEAALPAEWTFCVFGKARLSRANGKGDRSFESSI